MVAELVSSPHTPVPHDVELAIQSRAMRLDSLALSLPIILLQGHRAGGLARLSKVGNRSGRTGGQEVFEAMSSSY